MVYKIELPYVGVFKYLGIFSTDWVIAIYFNSYMPYHMTISLLKIRQ